MIEHVNLETNLGQICPIYVRKIKKPRKNSEPKLRTYDSEGFTCRAGCLCFKSEQEQEVLLISSNRFPDKWIVPGGGVEIGETANQAAVREVLEEAGVKGVLGRCLGIFEDKASHSRTAVFTLIVTRELEKWEDCKNGRRRAWFPVTEAKELLSRRPLMQAYIRQAVAHKMEYSEDSVPMRDSNIGK